MRHDEAERKRERERERGGGVVQLKNGHIIFVKLQFTNNMQTDRVKAIQDINKMAGRHGAPRPPMTDVGIETAFRLEKAQAFPKK